MQLFYSTPPQACPYISGRTERKVVTELRGPRESSLYQQLVHAGFRRSHSSAYRPACPACAACVPVRVRVEEFTPRRSHRRILTRNADLEAEERPAVATLEQYRIFKPYELTRHREDDMARMTFNDYRAMVEDSPVDTRIVEFRDADRRLVAVTLTDWLGDGLSGVYKFFAPERARTSPGTYIVLWHIAHARASKLPYVYLGYWIGECRKMSYKIRFQPMEALIDARWQLFDPDSGGQVRDGARQGGAMTTTNQTVT